MPTGAREKLAVIAIGGNSLLRDKDHARVSDQFEVTRETCRHIVDVVKAGWRVVVTHGNGPQIGFMLRRCELAIHELHPVPLDSLGANSQGSIGYMIQQSLGNAFKEDGVDKPAVAILTQVLVDPRDPAFINPAKPIGSFMSEEEAMEHVEKEGWKVKEDSGRGWRRVVASPRPHEIIETDAIKTLLEAGFVVIAGGGGGIPVVRDVESQLVGVAAVIDKDHASSLLARQLGADLFVISTGTDAVYTSFGGPDEEKHPQLTLARAKSMMAEGEFPPGSMGPKMQAVIDYLEAGGKRAIISNPSDLTASIAGKAGTEIVQGNLS